MLKLRGSFNLYIYIYKSKKKKKIHSLRYHIKYGPINFFLYRNKKQYGEKNINLYLSDII